MLRSTGIALAATLLFAGCFTPSAWAQASSGDRGDLTVEITGFESAQGRVRAGLFQSDDGFPLGVDDVSPQVEAPIDDGEATVEFDSIPHGTYAVVVYHDADADGTLDKNFVGMPTEGAGIYRPVDSRVPPPNFGDCTFEFDDAARTVDVELNYL